MSEAESAISLRLATMEDARMVFFWRNDPFIVARGSSQKTVTWEEHLLWFRSTVNGSGRKMFIVLAKGNPVGQVRFDRVNHETCAISAYLIREFTGRGLGVEAIRKGCDALFSEWSVSTIVACVREDNVSARAGFLKAGFMEAAEVGLCSAYHFTLLLRRDVPRDVEGERT